MGEGVDNRKWIKSREKSKQKICNNICTYLTDVLGFTYTIN